MGVEKWVLSRKDPSRKEFDKMVFFSNIHLTWNFSFLFLCDSLIVSIFFSYKKETFFFVGDEEVDFVKDLALRS